MRRLILVLAVLLGVVVGLSPSRVAAGEDVRVFAAASLSTVMQNVASALREAEGLRLKLVFAGSSTLARQIEAGADSDIFISADREWMDYLAKRKLIETSSHRPLLGNRLVVVTSDNTLGPLLFDKAQPWFQALGDGRISMGDPAHVPVGRYGKAALEGLGVWDVVGPRLAATTDTRAALALAERGEARAAIVYETDAAASPSVRVIATFPRDIAPEIVYPIALTGASPTGAARRAYTFICGSAAAKIFRAHGFGIR